MITARILNAGFGVFVPQVIVNHEVVSLDKQSSSPQALSVLRNYSTGINLVAGEQWYQAVEQAYTNLVNSLVPVNNADSFNVDDILFEKRGDTVRKVFVVRSTKNMVYIEPVGDYGPAIKHHKSDGLLFRKAI